MRVTPEQSKKVQEICFENKIFWKGDYNKDKINLAGSFLYIEGSITHDMNDTESEHFFREYNIEEIDADLFIRTNGTCEEDKYKMFDTMIQKPYDVVILEQKLKKKNEILKKARIRRKNQREELHKLNLKLQKCISLEEHTEALNDSYLRNSQLENDFREVRNLLTIKNNVIKELENENYLNKSKLHLSSLNNVAQQKEIEKLKAVIEYLESKVK
jgi:hypothetical protein